MTEAGWHPDPYGRFEVRYWDGDKWTDHVSTQGTQSTDPATGPTAATPGLAQPVVPTTHHTSEEVAAQAAKVVAAKGDGQVAQGGGTIFTEPVLVVNQKRQIIEINNEYGIFNAQGIQIGAVRQVGQSQAKQLVRAFTSYDNFMTHKFEIVDMNGAVYLKVVRPAKMMKSSFQITNGQDQVIGEIKQKNIFGKNRFELVVNGQTVGYLNAQDWRAWNFKLMDATEQEIGTISKTWEGLVTAMFTTADNYVIRIHRPLDDPLRSMVVASALCVDTALKQASGGFN